MMNVWCGGCSFIHIVWMSRVVDVLKSPDKDIDDGEDNFMIIIRIYP